MFTAVITGLRDVFLCLYIHQLHHIFGCNCTSGLLYCSHPGLLYCSVMQCSYLFRNGTYQLYLAVPITTFSIVILHLGVAYISMQLNVHLDVLNTFLAIIVHLDTVYCSISIRCSTRHYLCDFTSRCILICKHYHFLHLVSLF